MNTTDCINYKPALYDLLITPYHIFLKLCVSYDKTNLILVSIVRLIVIILIYVLLKGYKIIEFNTERIPQTLFYVSYIYFIIINVLYIIIILFKYPAIDKNEIEETTSNVAQILKQTELSKNL